MHWIFSGYFGRLVCLSLKLLAGIAEEMAAEYQSDSAVTPSSSRNQLERSSTGSHVMSSCATQAALTPIHALRANSRNDRQRIKIRAKVAGLDKRPYKGTNGRLDGDIMEVRLQDCSEPVSGPFTIVAAK